MTTSVLDRVPVDDITAHAKAIPFWRTVLRLVTFVPFMAGWGAAKAFGLAWLAVAWLWVALCDGWESAHGPSRGKKIDMLIAERNELREQLRRLGG